MLRKLGVFPLPYGRGSMGALPGDRHRPRALLRWWGYGRFHFPRGSRGSAFRHRTEQRPVLRQPFRHDSTTDIGESEVAALEAVGELQMVESEQVEQRGLKIVHVHGAISRVPADFI